MCHVCVETKFENNSCVHAIQHVAPPEAFLPLFTSLAVPLLPSSFPKVPIATNTPICHRGWRHQPVPFTKRLSLLRTATRNSFYQGSNFSKFWSNFSNMGMDQYLLIPFLGGWTSIYQLFWCSPGVPRFWLIPISDSPIFTKPLLTLWRRS